MGGCERQCVCEVLVMKTELKIVSVLIDAAEGEVQKPLLGEETSQILFK